jgi:hypothetical protein
MLTRCALLAILCGLGCGEKGQAGGESERTPSTTGEAPSAAADEGAKDDRGGGQQTMQAETVEIVDRDKRVEVEITPAPGLARTSSKTPTWMGSLDQAIPVTVTVGVECGGSCAPEAIPGNIEKAIEGAKTMARQPYYNHKDPEKAAIRAELEILHDDKEGELHLLAYRILYPEGFPTPDRFEVRGYLHRPGDNFYVGLQARSLDAERERWLEPLLTAVRSATIVAPPRTGGAD